ncbi:MAG: hypothetical protein ACK54C_18545 [Betaproteobacteria bacterium]
MDAHSKQDLAAEVAAHLSRVVDATPLEHKPFDHLVLTDPLPPALYSSFLAKLPTDEFYRPLHHSDAMLPDGRSARLQFPLIASNIRRLPDSSRTFWAAVTAGLHSPVVLDAYRRKFAGVLSRVRQKPVEHVRLRPYTTLFRDLGGYKISIHPDSPRKAVTTQFYLPQDDSQQHLGTLFHAREADSSFRLARAMRFAPNSGYAFAVTPHSYHSVAAMQNGDRPRNSLMIIINYDRGSVIETIKTTQKHARAVYDSLRGRRRPEGGEGRYEM